MARLKQLTCFDSMTWRNAAEEKHNKQGTHRLDYTMIRLRCRKSQKDDTVVLHPLRRLLVLHHGRCRHSLVSTSLPSCILLGDSHHRSGTSLFANVRFRNRVMCTGLVLVESSEFFSDSTSSLSQPAENYALGIAL